MNNSEQFNPSIGLYAQIINTRYYNQYTSNYNNINNFCLADKKIELKDKLLENVDTCLQLIDEYEKRGI